MKDNKFRDLVNKQLDNMTGHVGQVMKEYRTYRNTYGYERDQALDQLKKLIPGSLTEAYEKGFRPAFEEIHGKVVADVFYKIIIRLQNSGYSQSIFRRSFRSKDDSLYKDRFLSLMNGIYFQWEGFELSEYLKISYEQKRQTGLPVLERIILSELVALEIDEGNTIVLEAIKDICLGENNVLLLSHELIQAMVKCKNTDLHQLLGDLLLAAKLQEGLRQAILESADSGRVEAFIYLMKVILENNLVRFSSAVRAVGTWMGLGNEFDDKRVVEKLLKLGYGYVTDSTKRDAAVKSKDVIEVYAAMWAMSVYEVRDSEPIMKQLMQGEKYQKLVGLYFLGHFGNAKLQTTIAADYLHETDLDVLGYVMRNYRTHTGWHNKREEYFANCKRIEILQDKKVRDDHFAKLLAIAKLVPKKGHHVQGKPFEWMDFQFDNSNVFHRLLDNAGFDCDVNKISQLIDVMDHCDANNRVRFLNYFIDVPKNAKERRFLFHCLHDKSMQVRKQAVKNMKRFALEANEIELVQNLLSLKTGDLRQNVMQVLMDQKDHRKAIVKSLVADKQENKRLAGLDMLAVLVKENELTKATALEIIATMPAMSTQEQILVDQFTYENPKYTYENGFGLYDPAYRPEFPPLYDEDEKVQGDSPTPYVDKLFDIDMARLKGIFTAFHKKIEENKNYKYNVKSWDGSIEEVVLGAQRYLAVEYIESNENRRGMDRYPLSNVWRSVVKELDIQYPELAYIVFLNYLKMKSFSYGYNQGSGLNNYPWANELLDQYFHLKQAQEFVGFYKEIPYSDMIYTIISALHDELDIRVKFELNAGALIDLLKVIPEEDWSKPAKKESAYNGRELPLYQTDAFCFLIDRLSVVASTSDYTRVPGVKNIEDVKRLVTEQENVIFTLSKENFVKRLVICFEIGRRSGVFHVGLNEVDLAAAVTMGIVKMDALYRTIFLHGNPEYTIKNYTNVNHIYTRDNLVMYPVLKEAVTNVVNRVIEIELNRGDRPTEVSSLAASIYCHDGVDHFAKILMAMGKETFVRGYSWSSSYTKRDVLSNLLKSCIPSKEDTVEDLRNALAGKISDKRLIEAAMYSPSWIKLVGKLLNWKGFESTAWYFHAHTNLNFSAEKETEVARYSPITPEEFHDGAFDINWFQDAYKTIGKQRFEVMYDSAKYLSDGSAHRRAQLFADATLGKLKATDLLKEIKEKRNQDKLRSYTLIPLRGDKMKDALKRYEYIQQFLKESKKFGAQRRVSEGKATQVALENLARNAGFHDVLRFSWRMETFKIQQLTAYFEPKTVEDAQVHIEITVEGVAELVIEKAGKRLKSVPKNLKKHKYMIEIKEVISSLKTQFQRACHSLEKAMENADQFQCSELTALMEHPVIAPILRKLVFKSGETVGFFRDGALILPTGSTKLGESEMLSIAHPYDLYLSEKWSELQRYVFEHKLIQPFKQIFRELYVINEDEEKDGVKSRRYAGHQVQPKKTVALLKGRNWTVDYNEGLQRVYHKENIIATIYSMADWFSPADIEAPTLETVQFYDRKTYKPVPLKDVPPILFSEIMRDVDLVVSVAHVGGVDPEASHSTVEMRASIVTELSALLKLDNVVIDSSHAKVKGELGEYTVHLGSGVVHKMGRGAINILAIQSQHRGRIFLPFADEDPRTAEIMSKIVLLSEDHKIKDPSILSQIQ